VRDLAFSYPGVYLFNIYFFGYSYGVTIRIKVRVRVLGSVVGLGLGLIIPICRANLVLRVIWQRDIFDMTPAWKFSCNVRIIVYRAVFHSLPEPNRAWLLVVYVFTPGHLLC